MTSTKRAKSRPPNLSSPYSGTLWKTAVSKFGGLLFALFVEVIDLEEAFDKRPNQIRPNRPLMISLVALSLRAGILAFVVFVVGAECPQTIGRKQACVNGIYDRLLLLRGQR